MLSRKLFSSSLSAPTKNSTGSKSKPSSTRQLKNSIPERPSLDTRIRPVKIKIFARNGSKSRYMGEIQLRDETYATMLHYFRREVPFILNTHVEQRHPVALVA